MIQPDAYGNWFAIACLIGGIVCIVAGFVLVHAAFEWAFLR